MAEIRELTLPDHLKRSLEAGHPWVYRDHVPEHFRAESGTVVKVRAGGYSAYALWDARSAIALRVLSQKKAPDRAMVSTRVQRAWQLRQLVREDRSGGGETNCFRWLFGEGDGLPGLTADYYAGWVSMVTYGEALAGLVPDVIAALNDTTELSGVVSRMAEDEESRRTVMSGLAPPADLVVSENGVRLRANLLRGQKTGLFLDQRENRRTLERIVRASGAREVLNLYCYSGGFSVYAARGGAAHTVNVDTAAGALADARDNFALNAFEPDAHAFERSDVLEYLVRVREARRRFDVVVCDPPSFARNRDQVDGALRAYRRVNTLGLRVTEPGGYYVAASCTARVSPEAFRHMLVEAARKADVRLQIVHDSGHAPDHPIWAAHEEGRYLKCVVARVHRPS